MLQFYKFGRLSSSLLCYVIRLVFRCSRLQGRDTEYSPLLPNGVNVPQEYVEPNTIAKYVGYSSCKMKTLLVAHDAPTVRQTTARILLVLTFYYKLGIHVEDIERASISRTE